MKSAIIILLVWVMLIPYRCQESTISLKPNSDSFKSQINHYLAIEKDKHRLREFIVDPNLGKKKEVAVLSHETSDLILFAKTESEKSGLNFNIVSAIVKCESGWGEDKKHTNNNGTTDYGLWQLNNGGTMQNAMSMIGEEPTVENALDGYKNMKAGIALMVEDGLGPWKSSAIS